MPKGYIAAVSIATTEVTSRSELHHVVRLAAPAIAHSLLQTLVFLVDRLMLGHHSESALAAMQSAGPVVWTTYSVFGAFTVGTVAVVGRAVGARDARMATSALRGSLVLALVLGALVALVGSMLVDPVVRALGGARDEGVRAAAGSYLRIVFPAMPVLFVGLTAISALQAAGNTRTPFLIAIVTNCVNVAGNWVLIFGHLGAPRLGAAGAACSHVLALALEAFLGLWALASKISPVALRPPPGERAPAWPGVRRVLAVSWGSWGERVIYHAGYLAYVGFIVELGSAAMAANQALISIESVSFLTADGCAVAAGALVAQRLGEGNAERAARSAWIAAGLCAAILGACALLFASVPAALVRPFRDDPAVVAEGARALRIAALAQVPMAVAVVLAQALRGAGATREALVVSFAGALAVRLAATYVFVVRLRLGLVGVWMGSTTDWVVRALACMWRWRAGAWARTRVL